MEADLTCVPEEKCSCRDEDGNDHATGEVAKIGCHNW